MPIVAVGGTVTLATTVSHFNGSPADDPGLTLTISDTLGVPVAGFPVVIPPIVRDALGAYHFDWAVPSDLAVGDYTATWSATVDGAAAVGYEQVEVVTPGSVGAQNAYATFEQLLLTYRNPDAITEDDNLVARCRGALDEATADLIRELGWDYFPHASTTWIEPGEQGPVLHLHAGVVSLTTVEIDLTGNGTWTTLATTDWNLEPAKLPPDRPTYTHLRLAPFGAYSWWPTHSRAVRLTGVPGHATIPVDVTAATVASARVKLAADPTWPGAPIVPEALNEPVHAGRMPEATYRLVVAERQRFMACWI